ncbi:DUF1759 domain-containing protein [Wolbachia endosymbiont of Psylliodes chrysocephala]|uniref:DUF1759 domain-containing protein n=1 Tax=Wolbachia endosymbiont of Psylliodes chrysocephala TaxID=2883236 RepID=UPI0020A22B71|nr:DUF1759 domain-containing protein [Wolbachia endosymbiont of Psylliodes chrysocephala]
MQSFKVERDILKNGLKKIFKEIDELIKDVCVDKRSAQRLQQLLDDKAERVYILDNNIKEIMVSENVAVEDITTELMEEEAFREDIIKYKAECEYVIQNMEGEKGNQGASSKMMRNFNLPKLEMKKFDGNIKNWINFWGQFKKIHEDQYISTDDKFQYLLQATEEGSSVRNMIESFPPSGANYNIAIDQMKARFARDEVLIEVYVRELLNLVLNQQTSVEMSGIELSTLYDKLETQLRALESLGVTRDKYAAMLFPLVESALPCDLLKIWERHRIANNKQNVNDLQGLLDFLKAEVEAEERTKIAKTKFLQNKGEDPINEKTERKYTVESLYSKSTKTNFKEKLFCIFCDKTHASQDCIKAQNMTLDQKRTTVIKKRGCFSCLKLNHTFRTCKSAMKCIICARKHHAIMCPDLQKKGNENKDRIVDKPDENVQSLQNTLTTTISETLLQTLKVKLYAGKKCKIVRILLDSASQRSYVTKKCAEEMNLLKLGEENIVQGVFGGAQGESKMCQLFSANIYKLDKSFSINVSVLEQQRICNYIPKLNDIKIIEYLKNKDIILSDTSNNDCEISLLIGADNIGKLLTGNIENIDDNLFAVETKLGWTVMGQQYCINQNKCIASYFTGCSITDLWNLDVLGIKESAESKNKELLEVETLNYFRNTTVLNNENRYEIYLPWIQGCPNICSNYNLAEKRLFSNTRRLITLKKFTDYGKVFEEWEKLGIIEEVSEENVNENVHYLAHQAVIKESSNTTKIRPVFDGSAKDKNGNSLNDLLQKGPNLIELTIPLIIKFRIHKIGLTADITKAFLQISIIDKDRDYLRFLWWQNYSERIIKIYRHCRVVFGLKPSPFILAATINLHLEKLIESDNEFKETAKVLLNAFYVDNCVHSVRNSIELKMFIKQSKDLLEKAHFELRGWTYNSTNENNFEPGNSNHNVSVLGILWDFKYDNFICDIQNLGKFQEIPRTKRGLLSAAQKMFDPIGFTAPVTLLPKLLLQETWKLKLSWDQKLPEEIIERFESWLKNVKFLSLCAIPRHIAEHRDEQDIKHISLHVFVDASKLAYASCIFVRLEFEEKVLVTLLLAKTRISPVKPITLPRLELMAALTVQQVDYLRNRPVFFWSDSMVTLTWIKTKGNWNTFVDNRVKEIRKLSTVDQWNHVPGVLNTADILSRGCNGKQLLEKQWWCGPDWLKNKRELWPNGEMIFDGVNEEVKKERKVVNTNVVENKMQFSQNLGYFSKYSKIKRMLAWILRFYFNSKNRINQNRRNELTSEELERAENCLFRMIQEESITNELDRFKRFQIFQNQNGILKLKTRLVYGDFPEEFKYPIILPDKHDIVRKLIMEEHISHCHAGPKILLGILRERFWILRAKKVVHDIISKCVVCRKQNVKSVQTPFAPLPENRIKNAGVFEVIGVDLAGPLYLKDSSKVWIVLFTCAIYRAVHLELVKSLSTEAFLYALRRFISRRGRPQIVYSDNGTNFHGTDNYFAKLNWDEIEIFSGIKRIKWLFNPPSAAWWGGWWERLIRLIKELLRRNLGKASLYYVELYTILCDVESVINQRPLTYVSEDDWEILSPSKFIKPLQGASTEVVDLDLIDTQNLRGRFRYMQTLRESLRKRFKSEYLAELVNVGQRLTQSLKVDDVVLVGNDSTKRTEWPLGRIVEIYNGKDNVTRVAKVKTATGYMVRPYQRLYPLEMSKKEKGRVVEQTTKKKTEEKARKEVIDNGNLNEERRSRYGRILKQPERLEI